MNTHRTLRPVGKIAALAVASSLVVATAPAEAASTKIGPVKGLGVQITKPADQYLVASDWTDLAGATAYKVSLTQAGGTVLQSDTVTASEWTAGTTLGAGTSVTVKVVPLAGRRAGRPASVTRPLPDLTAPNGTFELAQATPGSRDVTLDQVALSDDVTPAGSIVRKVNWDDGTPSGSWSSSHRYDVDLAAYDPTVTLEDAAGNVRVVPLGTVVVGDQTAPTGAFAATGSGWADWTPVALTETTTVKDNFSAADKLTRTVLWGDGATDTWTGSVAPTHVYAEAGTYSPQVRLTDEAGNPTTTTVAAPVVVSADTDDPTVKVTKPATRRTWVRKWTTLRGKVSDPATGVKAVSLRLVEKRGASWYAYRSATRRWVRGGSTQAAALSRATVATALPTATNKWSYAVSGLRKGRLVVQVKAADNVRNACGWKTVSQALTHS